MVLFWTHQNNTILVCVQSIKRPIIQILLLPQCMSSILFIDVPKMLSNFLRFFSILRYHHEHWDRSSSPSSVHLFFFLVHCNPHCESSPAQIFFFSPASGSALVLLSSPLLVSFLIFLIFLSSSINRRLLTE